MLDVQLSNLFRNESAPTDVVFDERIERLVNDTRLNLTLRFTPLGADPFQIVIRLTAIREDPPFQLAGARVRAVKFFQPTGVPSLIEVDILPELARIQRQ